MTDDEIERRHGMEELRREVSVLQDEMRVLSDSIQGMVAAWEASKGVLLVIKWTAAVGFSIAGIWSFIKNGHAGG